MALAFLDIRKFKKKLPPPPHHPQHVPTALLFLMSLRSSYTFNNFEDSSNN